MRRCLGCFENINDTLEICPFCGYVVGTPAEDESYLEPGTLLSGRYLIGKVIRKDYVGVVYAAWDQNANMKVAVREYLPEDSSIRLAGSTQVVPSGDEKKKQFDDGFNEFVDEAKRLFAGGGKLRLFDCIAENGTAYMIMENPEKKKPAAPVKASAPAFAPKKPAVTAPEPAKSTPAINVIKAEKKDNVGYNLSRKISLLPMWVKIVVPAVIVLGAVAVILITNGVFDSIGKDRTAETSEAPIEEQIIMPAEVLTWGFHSYACFDHCEKWEEAEEYCEALGGHLGVITSREENDVILTYIQTRGFDNVYIGYSDSEIEGVWRWVNGEQSSFTNWNEGEPNAFTNEEDYAVFTALASGAWNDGDYSPRVEDGSICFMCEWDSVVTGESNVTYEELTAEAGPQDDSGADSADVAGAVPAAAVAAGGIRPHILIDKSSEYDSDFERTESLEIKLAGTEADSFPGLESALSVFNQKIADRIASINANNGNIGAEVDAEVIRADERIVSIAYSFYDPYYGAHGDDSYGMTLDTATGAEITLSDVVVDINGFNAIVNSRIDAVYGNAVWEPGADHVSRYDPNDPLSYIFTVGNEGVTVYFECLDILNVTLGEPVKITVTYSENPALFSDYYFTDVGDYIEWWDGHPVFLDVDSDGVADEVSVEFIIDERELRVHLGQQTITDEQEGLYNTSLFIVRKNGVYYVYAFMMMENDYVFLEVFNLLDRVFEGSDVRSTPACIWFDDGYGTSPEQRFPCVTDPDDFVLVSQMYTLSNCYDGYRSYRVGDDGIPEAVENYYQCLSTLVLCPKIDIACDLVDEYGNVIGQAVIPTGTYLFHLRTDNLTYVDFQQVGDNLEITEYGAHLTGLSDPDYTREIYRVYVDRSGWPQLVNGIDENECFDGIAYGG